jgi:hypothetical protein
MRPRLAACVLLLAATARADGPADNVPDRVRQVPRPGIEVSPTDRAELEAGLATLKAAINNIEAHPKS